MGPRRCRDLAALVAALVALGALTGCPNAVYPVPPPLPNLTHTFAADPSGSTTPSFQLGGGYPEFVRATVGISHTLNERVAFGIDGTWVALMSHWYGRPTVAVYLHPHVTLIAGGTVGRIFSSNATGGPTWFGGDLMLRFGSVLRPSRVQLWMGVYGGYTSPVTDRARTVTEVNMGTTTTYETGWAPSYHAGAECAVFGPLGRDSIVQMGLLIYALAGNRADSLRNFYFWDVGGLLALRIQIPPPREAASSSPPTE